MKKFFTVGIFLFLIITLAVIALSVWEEKAAFEGTPEAPAGAVAPAQGQPQAR